MKNVSKKIVLTLLTVSSLFLNTSIFNPKSEARRNTISIENSITDTAISWLAANHGAFYNLRDINANITEVVKKGSETQYTILLECETFLKCKDAKDLPFVQGLSDALSAECELATVREAALDNFIKSIDGIGEWHGLALEVVVTANKNNPKQLQVNHYKNGLDKNLVGIDALKLDPDQMYKSGYAHADYALKAVTQNNIGGYADYNRIEARDYALRFTTNINSCYDDGTSCGMLQYRPIWNNNMYPYFSLFKHNDCANFVSQAMAYGRLPQNTGANGWFRTSYSQDQSWSAAWTNVASLKSYMTNSSRGYWSPSNFDVCNAGNIILTSSSHVVMITLNDTVTHRFTGHTNDRLDFEFSNTSGWEYYEINRI